jgi:uncharacterized paraquat-inducible protein A
MAVCYYHPDRPGVGICVRCRTVICAACSTRLDGINHCHRCLSKLAARPDAKAGSLAPSMVFAAVLLVVAWLILFGLLYLAGGLFAPTLHAAADCVQAFAGTSHG